MNPAIVLLFCYILVTILLQVVGFGVSKLVELIDPTLSLMTFLTLFLGAFWLGFPLAVWLSDMLVSANADERARERAALAGTARPQP